MQTTLFNKAAVLMEQNQLQCILYRDILSANGFDVYVAKSAMDGLMKIKEEPQDLTVINVEIAEETFIEKLINKIHSESTAKFMPIIGLSLYNQENKKNMIKNFDAFLTKPHSIDRFIESVFVCIEKKHNDSENTFN